MSKSGLSFLNINVAVFSTPSSSINTEVSTKAFLQFFQPILFPLFRLLKSPNDLILVQFVFNIFFHFQFIFYM